MGKSYACTYSQRHFTPKHQPYRAVIPAQAGIHRANIICPYKNHTYPTGTTMLTFWGCEFEFFGI